MSWWSDVTDNLSSAWDNLRSGDILGAAEDLFNFGLDAISLGTFSYLKDQVRGLYDVPDIPYQDRKRTVRAPTGPRQVVYGRTRVGGQLAYMESFGPDKRFLMMTLIVAAHAVKEISGVYANKVKVASAGDGFGLMPTVQGNKYITGANSGYIICWSSNGSFPGWIIPDVIQNGKTYNPPNWTSAHRLDGQAYVHVVMIYGKDIFDSGMPNIEVELKGKKDIYDPRTGQSGYTDNQALIALDILRWERMFNLPDSKINMTSFITAANVADQLVASGPGTTEKRYTVNGAFLMQTPPLEILSSIGKAGASYPVRFQGEWSIVPGAYSAPVMNLDESDLIGGLKFQPGPGKSARHNKARGSYVDASQNFETVEFRELSIGAYILDDLEELERSFEFPWSNSGSMARRLAKIEIERGRYGLSASAVFKFRALQLTPGDRITLSIAQLGWVNKVFRVEDRDADMNAGVKLGLREDAPEVYAWTEGDSLALDSPPPVNLPNGLEISPPQNVVITEDLYQTLTRAAVKVRMRLSWDTDDVASAYDIQYKLATKTEWINAGAFWKDNDIEINDVLDAEYDLRLRATNTIGLRSDWLTLSYTVEGKSAPPPDVGTLLIEKGTLKWSYDNAPLDLAGFEVRFQNGDRRLWVDATPVTGNVITETQFDASDYTGVKTFLVKAIDTTGNVSKNAAILVQNLGDALVENVIATQSEGPAWAGTLTGGFINASSELEADQLGVFWGDPDAVFWPLDTNALFWIADYERVTYEYTFVVGPEDTDADLTVDVQIGGPFNEKISYKTPGYTGGWRAFPGSVEAKEGTYSFLLTVPQQAFGAAPTVIDVVTGLDVEDIEESFNDIAISASGTRLPITKQYRSIKNVSLTLQSDGGTGTSVVIIDKDPVLGPLVGIENPSKTLVTGNLDSTIQGY